jgi:sugar O-acyltransferase (sialic acid O-acetyltransferase NeuD family)
MKAYAAGGRPLLIFPCNGNAAEALDCLGSAYTLIGFIDDASEKQGTTRHGFPVFGRDALSRWPDASVLAVPGGPRTFGARREAIDGLGVGFDRFARVVHPAASVSQLASVGRNVLIMAGVVITSNARICDHVCILPNSVIHHDAVIGERTLIGSNVTVAGGVKIGANAYIASGSSLIDGIEVGAGALVGLGSNVLRTVPANARVAGNPARTLRGAP